MDIQLTTLVVYQMTKVESSWKSQRSAYMATCVFPSHNNHILEDHVDHFQMTMYKTGICRFDYELWKFPCILSTTMMCDAMVSSEDASLSIQCLIVECGLSWRYDGTSELYCL